MGPEYLIGWSLCGSRGECKGESMAGPYDGPKVGPEEGQATRFQSFSSDKSFETPGGAFMGRFPWCWSTGQVPSHKMQWFRGASRGRCVPASVSKDPVVLPHRLDTGDRPVGPRHSATTAQKICSKTAAHKTQ